MENNIIKFYNEVKNYNYYYIKRYQKKLFINYILFKNLFSGYTLIIIMDM